MTSSARVEFPRPPEGLDSRWYFSVGPTQLHPLVPGALRDAVARGLPSWSHRSARFRLEVEATTAALRTLLEVPPDHRVLFLSSATEAMERIIQGAVKERSFHFVNGAFADRFRAVAVNLGKIADAERAEWGEGFDLDGAAVPEGVELVALTQNETSTGVALDPAAIARLIRRSPGPLAAVDAVTAAPTAPLDLAAVDAAFFSVQKLFGLPAGLGVLIASPRLIDRSRELQREGVEIGGYLTLPTLARSADRSETAATPNALGIHLLGRVAEDFLERGLDGIRSQARAGAAQIRAAATRAGWRASSPMRGRASETILVFEVPGGSGPVRDRLANAGFVTGSGYGDCRDSHLRIANFPAHSEEAIAALCKMIEICA